ncbi:MAG TPA: hypothetical protein VES88_11995 [Gemmatimonadaceae bacterium]|nr:hypothetical protein [Gemmatimonadaceae bacterium]
MAEERLVIWHGIPTGSLLKILVTPEMATVEGRGFFKSASGSKTPLRLGVTELVDNPLRVPIRQGDQFFLLIEMTYLSPSDTSVVVDASIADADGQPVTNADGNVVTPFRCEYTGSLGGANATDEVQFNVRGAR